MAEPPAVLLQMEMPSRRSVDRIPSALWNVPGVISVSASDRMAMVVVRGDMYMDSETVKHRLEYATGRRFEIVVDAGRSERSHHVQAIMPYAPPAPYGHLPPPAPYSYGYPQAPPAYPYQYGPPAPYYGRRQYGGPPSVFDDTIPGNACTIM